MALALVMIKKDEIFKSYTRRNNSPDRDKEWALGFSICQTIIEAHNGETMQTPITKVLYFIFHCLKRINFLISFTINFFQKIWRIIMKDLHYSTIEDEKILQILLKRFSL